MIPDPEEVLEVARQLKETRELVRQLEARWASFFSASQQSTLTLEVAPLKTRIVNLLSSRATDAFTIATISNLLEANPNSVGPYLSDLAAEGRIERRGRGMYGAKTLSDNGSQEEGLTAA